MVPYSHLPVAVVVRAVLFRYNKFYVLQVLVRSLAGWGRLWPHSRAIAEPPLKKARLPPIGMPPPTTDVLPSGFLREDLVRLLTQCMQSLGYTKAAGVLEEESGIPLLMDSVASFRSGIIDGRWDDVERLIDGLEIRSEVSRVEVHFLVLRQKFLELVEAQRTDEALRCLRQQLTPLDKKRPSLPSSKAAPPTHVLPHAHTSAAASPTLMLPSIFPPGVKAPVAPTNVPDAYSLPQLSCPAASQSPLPSQLQRHGMSVAELSCYLMCKTPEELRLRAGWDGAQGESRKLLLHELQRHIPPSHLLPENRLETLLQQAISWQMSQCLWRESAGEISSSRSLLENVSLAPDQIPRETRHVLEKHSDEVWFVKFSHNGKLLASASKDNMVMIWDVTHPEMDHAVTLQGHTDYLSFVAWSPDDQHILTCSNDRLIKLWEVVSGECCHTYAKHVDAVTACAWLPDGMHFVSAGVDKNVHIWSRNGDLLQTWHGPRVNDLAVSHTGDRLVAICSERKILMCRIDLAEGGTPVLNTSDNDFITEAAPITSLSLSRDSRYLLVNVSSEEIHSWDLERKVMIHRYRGQKQGRFVIRSAFGGQNEAFVASGSEDSQVYIWNRHTSMLVEVLPGHSGTVNAIAWNPMDPLMFASASDDHTVRVWGVAS